ncbi:hypothetical protein HY993_03315 [Candidatus Micrarchaeota archaeon]|nr:hypothetical protein [Candidatus Micrarchaeota archaeon]
MQQMGGMCTNVSGLLVFLSGVSFLGLWGSYLNSMTAHLISGVLLSLFGLGLLMHANNLCPNCKIVK